MWDSKPVTCYRQGTHNSVSLGKWMSCEETKIFHFGASDWKVLVDLKTSLQFPVHILQTEKRSDIVAWSDSKKSVLLELTVLYEENGEEAPKVKKNRYKTSRADCVEKGWVCHMILIEVDCRGFLDYSVISFLSKIGIICRSYESCLILSSDQGAICIKLDLVEREKSSAWIKLMLRNWCYVIDVTYKIDVT